MNSPRFTLQGMFRHGLPGLTLAIVVAALYRYFWLDARDPLKCNALLNHGRWLDPPESPHFGQPLQNWQPPGCMLFNYQASEIKSCMGARRMIFIGDSTVRQVFWATAKKVDRRSAEAVIKTTPEHSDIEFHQAGVKIDFIWDPFLNSSKLYTELTTSNHTAIQPTIDGEESTGRPFLMLIGGGLWYARFVAVEPLQHFKDAINSIARLMSSTTVSLASVGTADTLSAQVGSPNLFLFAPVQRPWYPSLSAPRSATITSDMVDSMNSHLQPVSTFPGINVIWSYSAMTREQKNAYDDTGLHVVDNVAAKKADILLNLRCNAQISAQGGPHHPFNKTCCNTYGHHAWVQWLGLFMGSILLPGIYWTHTKGWPSAVRTTTLPWFTGDEAKHQTCHSVLFRKRLHALTVLSLALCYCFYADRTQMFNKVHKQYSFEVFATLCILAMICGILSIRRSKRLVNRNEKSAETRRTDDQSFLSRDQTNEWRGWMQFLILIYHYTGASKVLWIYQIVRLLVASYLFMTGYGHTVFFLKKKDYSFRRVATVLVRLNLLTCALPYMMRTDYLFYYFAPLVSFWFLVVYFTLRLCQSRNDNAKFLYGKIIASAILVAVSTKTKGIIEFVFALLEYSCRIHWNAPEWRFRVFLDMFIVHVGMICAVLSVRSSSALGPGGRMAFVVVHDRWRRIAIIISSAFILPTYVALAHQFPSKFDYNRWHPYISCVPILAFVVLRNAHRHLRGFHSSIFAWLGKCSLETFILQFHIWLAGDTTGLLSLGVLDPAGVGKWIEFGVLTAVFLWISRCVSAATNTVTTWILATQDGEEKSSQRYNVNGGTSLELVGPYRRSEPGHENGTSNPTPASRSAVRRFSSCFVALTRPWTNDLRVRIGLMLFLMWLLNMVRFSSL